MVAAPVAGIGDAGPESPAFAEATADKSSAAKGASGEIPSAVSSTHAVQSPLGASERIFAPHLRQILITLIIARDSACVLILYCVKFCHILRLSVFMRHEFHEFTRSWQRFSGELLSIE
jgi:hypothetical protein